MIKTEVLLLKKETEVIVAMKYNLRLSLKCSSLYLPYHLLLVLNSSEFQDKMSIPIVL